MVRQAVYQALEEQKRPGESFSRVLERLLSRGPGIGSLRGLWGRSPPQGRKPSGPGQL